MSREEILLKLIEILVRVTPPKDRPLEQAMLDLNADGINHAARFHEAADWVAGRLLTEEDIRTIAGWYHAAAGESATGQDAQMFSLLDKLGIEASAWDLFCPDPMKTHEKYRAEVYPKISAIKAYRKRHPELESVQNVELEDPTGDA